MARVLVGDSRDAVRWLAGRGIRFRLMYERQAYPVGIVVNADGERSARLLRTID
jgi:hypothetical protein